MFYSLLFHTDVDGLLEN